MAKIYNVAVKVFVQGAKSGKKDLEGVGASARAVGAAVTGMAAGATVAAAVMARALGTIVEWYAEAARAANVQRQAEAQVEASIRSTGMAAGWTLEQLKRSASELQGRTIFGDEIILEAQAIGLTFTKIAGETFPAFIEASLDLSSKMGTDLNSAIVQVGKALNDPIKGITALQRVGVSFSSEQKSVITSLVETNRLAEAQGLILEELATEFGGSAEAQRKHGGATKALQNAWGDLLETVGMTATAFDPVIELGVDLLEWINETIVAGGKLNLAFGSFMLVLSDASLLLAGIVRNFANAAGTIADINEFFGTRRSEEARAWADNMATAADGLEKLTQSLAQGGAGQLIAWQHGASDASDAARTLTEEIDRLSEAEEELAKKLKSLSAELETPLETIRREAAESLAVLDQSLEAGFITATEHAELLHRLSSGYIDDLAKQAQQAEKAIRGLIPKANVKVDVIGEEKLDRSIKEQLRGLTVNHEGETVYDLVNRETGKIIISAHTAQDEWSRAAVEIGQLLGDAFGEGDEGILRMIDSAMVLVDAFDRISEAQTDNEKAFATAGAISAGYDVGQALGLFGPSGGQGRLGGSLEGNYAAEGAAVGSAIGMVIGAAAAAYFTAGMGTAAGAALGGAIGSAAGGILGGFVSKGADEALATLYQVGNDLDQRVSKSEGNLRPTILKLGDSIIDTISRLESVIGDSITTGTFSLKIRDDVVSVFVNGLVGRFEDMDDAILFAVTEVLRTAEFGANAGENIKRGLTSGGFGSIEELQEVTALATDADALAAGLEGVGLAFRQLEIQARRDMQVALEHNLVLEDVVALGMRRIEQLRDEVMATADSIIGVSDRTKALLDLKAGFEQFNEGIERTRTENERLLETYEAQIVSNQHAQEEIEAATKAREEAAKRAAEAGETLDDSFGRVEDGMGEALKKGNELGQGLGRLENVLVDLEGGAAAARATLAGLPDALDLQKLRDAFEVAGGGLVIELLTMLRAVHGEQFGIAEQQQIQADIYKLQLALQYASLLNLLATSEGLFTISEALLDKIGQAVDVALAADPASINLGGGGGSQRRDQRESLSDQIDDLLAEGLDPAQQIFRDFEERLEKFREEARLSGLSASELARGEAALAAAREAALKDLGEQTAASLSPMFALRLEVRGIGETMDLLRDHFEAFGLTAEEVDAILKDASLGVFARIAADVADLTGNEELAIEAQKLATELRLAQLRLEIMLLSDLGLLTQEQVIRMNELLNDFERRFDEPVAPSGGSVRRPSGVPTPAPGYGVDNMTAFADIGAGLAQILDDEELLREFELLRMEITLLNYEMEIELLLEKGMITEAQAERLGGMLDDAQAKLDGLRNPDEEEDGGGVVIDFGTRQRIGSRDSRLGAKLEIESLVKDLKVLEDEFESIGLTAEEAAAATAGIKEGAFLDLWEQFARGRGDAEALKRIEEARLQIEFALAEFRINQLEEEGILSAEQAAFLRGELEFWRNQQPPGTDTGQTPLPGVYNPLTGQWQGGYSTGAAAEAQERMNAAYERLLELEREAGSNASPFERQLAEINAEFLGLIDVLGESERITSLWAEALWEAVDQFVESIERFQRGLLVGEQSPLHLRDRAGLALADLQAAALDPARIGEVTGLAQVFLDLSEKLNPQGSASFDADSALVQAILDQTKLTAAALAGTEISKVDNDAWSAELAKQSDLQRRTNEIGEQQTAVLYEIRDYLGKGLARIPDDRRAAGGMY